MDEQMSPRRALGVALALVATALLMSGCGTNGGEVNVLTWQEAKRDAQSTAIEIATQIPKELVASIDQMPDGTLLSCDETRHQWAGFTNVVLADGADEASVLTDLEERFRDSKDFTVVQRTGRGGGEYFQLIAVDGEESYIVAPGMTDGSIEIASGSACFTLPEGTYPGGKF